MEYLYELYIEVLWHLFPSYAKKILMAEVTEFHIASDSKWWI